MAIVITIAVAKLARLPLRLWLGTLRPVLPFFFCLFLLYVLLTPGRPLPGFSWGPVQISYEGLSMGIIQVGKFLLLILAAALLTMTTSQTEIIIGLERLLRPLRIIGISSHDVAMMISLALRFMPDLAKEMKNISEAQLARGANFNPRRMNGKIRAISYLAAPLAINLFRRGDELVEAMEARGYQRGHRTYLRELILTGADYGLIGIFVLVLMAVLLL
jgi:biotin transport system permease protein